MIIVGVQNFSNVLKYPENIQNDFFESENVRVLYKNEMSGIFNIEPVWSGGTLAVYHTFF